MNQEEVKEPIQEEVKIVRRDITAEESGIVLGSTFDDRYRVCKILAASSVLPPSFNTPEKVWAGIHFAIELGYKNKILSILKNVAIIRGSTTIYGELPLALVYRSGFLEHIKEFLIDTNGNEICLANSNVDSEIYAAVCRIKRVNHELHESVWTRKMSETAKLYKNEVWGMYESIMMKRKARALALKDQFPDVLLGLTIAEYDYNKAPDLGDEYETEKISVRSANELNKILNSQEVQEIERPPETKKEYVTAIEKIIKQIPSESLNGLESKFPTKEINEKQKLTDLQSVYNILKSENKGEL
jgi:hypothetical protein